MNNEIGTLFEMASQFKFRYPFKGMITTEDLWDLSQSELDTVYKALNKELNVVQEEGLLRTKSADEGVKASDLRTKLMIVKHIFTSKQQAANQERVAAENAMKRKRIMDILAQKQNDALQNMSEEDLLKMLNDLS